MEHTFTIVVKTTGLDHSRLIREDIKNAIRLRTVGFYISEPMYGHKTIEELFKEDEESALHEANR